MADQDTEERKSIAQLAEEEAQRAEADDASAEPGGEPGVGEGERDTAALPEPTIEPEPLEPGTAEPVGDELSEAEAEFLGELEKANTAYHKRIEKAHRGRPMPPQCPACQGLGFDLTGGEPPPELKQHDRFVMCEHCDGFGLVATGSKVPQAAELRCPTCGGNGYIDRLTFRPDQPSIPQPIAPGPNGEPPAGWEPWMGDPHKVAGTV